MDFSIDKHKAKVMEKIYMPHDEKEHKGTAKRDVGIPCILVLLMFTLLCCLFMSWTSLFGKHQTRIEVHETIVEKLFLSESKLEEPVTKFGNGRKFMRELNKDYFNYQKQMNQRRTQNRLSWNLKDLKSQPDPEMNMTACQIANRWGYKCESHSVTTEDGYILTMHRMPSTTSSNSTASPYPVFLQHGLLSSSSDWLDNLPNISLAYILADNGYDVWMGNFRGNFYSRRHKTLDPSTRPFWRFSWDEMAAYDLPAMIHYTLNQTGHQDLFYAGHSQGTMTAFAQFAQNQEIGHRVRMFFALAPVTTVGHMTDYTFNALAPFANEVRDLLYDFGFVGEFIPRGVHVIDWLNEHICVAHFLEFICEDIMWTIAGIQKSQLNETRIPVYISQTPAGTSLENMVHFAQMVKSKKFQKYDFGNTADNMKHYNQPTPPEYSLKTLKTPLTLYWGGKDWLADAQDVLQLFEKVSHIEHSKFIPEYDHLDFMWGQTAPERIYNDMLEVMKKKLLPTESINRLRYGF